MLSLLLSDLIYKYYPYSLNQLEVDISTIKNSVFTRLLNLAAVNEHESLHPSCDQCGEVFAISADLQTHMESHIVQQEEENIVMSSYQEYISKCIIINVGF